jgi:hypothetical protein
MKSKTAGKSTSQAEVTNISPFGIWLIVKNTEYFLPYTQYPWFKEAKVSDILDLKLLHGSHLFWPTLDIDLEEKSFNNLEKYSLIYR